MLYHIPGPLLELHEQGEFGEVGVCLAGGRLPLLAFENVVDAAHHSVDVFRLRLLLLDETGSPEGRSSFRFSLLSILNMLARAWSKLNF